MRIRNSFESVWQDLSYALRSLWAAPGFTLGVCLTLSLAVGLNLAFVQILSVTVLQPPRIKDPDTLARFERRIMHQGSGRSQVVPYAAAQFIERHSNVLSAVLTQTVDEVAWGEAEDKNIRCAYVSANWFDELGYGAAFGRVFAEEIEESPDARPVVILSHEFWRRSFHQNPGVVGSTVWVNKRPAVVIGVAPQTFPGLRLQDRDVWLPIDQHEYFVPGSNFRADGFVEMYGRLQPGISAASAKAGLQTLLHELAKQTPTEYQEGEWLEPYLGAVGFEAPEERRQTWLVALGVGGLTVMVFLVACANLSNLILSRSLGRLRELGVRTALGATPWRVMRLVVTESALLATAGSAGGWMLGDWASRLFAVYVELPSYLDLAPDWRTVLAAGCAAALAISIAGLLPAWRLVRCGLLDVLQDGGQQATARFEKGRLRRAMVAIQVAGSCLLLVIAVMTVLGLQRMLGPAGFQFEHIAVLEAPLYKYGIFGGSARSYWEQVMDEVAMHPETERMTIASLAPLGDRLAETTFRDAPGLQVTDLRVDPRFFSVTRIPILFGRTFEASDKSDYGASDKSDTAVIVSRTLAVETYGTANVVGRRFPRGSKGSTIVGVVGDAPLIKYQAPDVAERYRPVDLEAPYPMLLLVAAKTDPERLLAPMRRAAQVADSRVIPEVRLLRADFAERLRLPRLIAFTAAVIASIVLLLVGLGVFAIVSYSASLREREIGIRRALGARPGSIVRLLSVQLGAPVSIGILGGVFAAIYFEKLLESQFVYLRSAEPLVYAASILILAGSGSLAVFLSALKAIRSEPLDSLRHV